MQRELNNCSYNTARIRVLLTDGFTAEELRRFCFDDRDFRSVYNKLAPNTGKDVIIDKMLEHAELRCLFRVILDWAKKNNPLQYKIHEPYHTITEEKFMTDPYSITWALMVMEKATEFLFNQAGEILKEWRTNREKTRKTSSQLQKGSDSPGAPPLVNPESLTAVLKERLIKIEQQTQEIGYEIKIQEIDSLTKQLEDLHRNKLMYEEEATKLPGIDDRIAIRRRIEDTDREIAHKAIRMRQMLEQISQREIYIPILDD